MATEEKPSKTYRFETFGPFEIPLEDGEDVDRASLHSFWNNVEHYRQDLSEALGCYIFGIQNELGSLPWYVGKTEQRSFKFEVFQPHKLVIYRTALKMNPGGRAVLFLLPRMTDGGRFRKVWRTGSSSVARLERMLIESCLRRNPALLNQQMTKHLTQTVVPGYVNESKAPRSPEAELLAAMLGVPSTSDVGREAALSTDAKDLSMPDSRVALDLKRSFTGDEMRRIKKGFIPHDQDDRWFIYFAPGERELRIHRCVSGYCDYAIKFRDLGPRFEIEDAWVNADPNQHGDSDPRYDSAVANWIIDCILLGRDRAFPTK